MSRKKSPRKPRIILVGFLIITILIGIGSSIYLTRLHYYCALKDAICDISDTISCSEVACGPFSTMLKMPIAYLGILTYLVCLVFTLLGMKPEKSRFHAHVPNYLLVISAWCVVYSIFLACVSAFLIKAYCLFCMVLYVVNVLMLIYAVIWSKDVPEGRWMPFFNDVKDWIGLPRVWGAAALTGLVLVISSYACSSIKIKLPEQEFPPMGKIPLADHPVKGSRSAPVQVVEVSETKCPWCAMAHSTVNQAVKTYGDKFYVIFVNFPLDKDCNTLLKHNVHPQSCVGSYAARCAQKQGKFWEFVDLLFERRQDDWNIDALATYAKELGMNEDRFRKCMADPATAEYIKQDIDGCIEEDIHSVPTFYFNGKRYGNVASNLPRFLEHLEKALTEVSEESKVTTSESSVVPALPGAQ